MRPEGTLRIKADAENHEVLVIVANDNGDELSVVKLAKAEQVEAIAYGLLRAMAIAQVGGKP